MKAFLETTHWPDTEFNCNHVYWMDDSKNKMHAYAKFGNPAEVTVFKNPIKIDTRGRKFEPVRNDIYGWVDPDQASAQTWKFTGSKGDVYTVEQVDHGHVCSCPGFQFRGQCRHITEIMEKAQ